MRAFIAIDLPEEIKKHLSEIQSKLLVKEAELNPTNSFHLTLKFLGDIDDSENITKNLSNIKSKKFKLNLTSLGFFPNKNYIRVIWVGTNQNKKLTDIAEKIDTSLPHFKRDHKFHPHITLARVKNVFDKQEFKKVLSNIKIQNLEFDVKDFILYKSTLTRQGPIYEKVQTFDLS